MRLLVDQSLKPHFARALYLRGYDVVHTADINMQRAADVDLFVIAREQNRVFVTADKRLLKYIADQGANSPSIILIRGYQRDMNALDDVLAALLAVEQARENG